MSSKLLIYKCRHCKKWNHLEDDAECACGNVIHEPGDANADPKYVAAQVREIDLNQIILVCNELKEKLENTKFKLVFKDGAERIIEAPTFSSAVARGAYERHAKEGKMVHTALTVEKALCKKIL